MFRWLKNRKQKDEVLEVQSEEMKALYEAYDKCRANLKAELAKTEAALNDLGYMS